MSLLKRSPWISFYEAGGCNGCMIEFFSCVTPKYDIERLGCKVEASAKHADILVISGPVGKQARPIVKNLYSQLSEPKKVIALGVCAISGGPFKDSYVFDEPLDTLIPVDVYVPGCPPRPEAIIDAIRKVLNDEDKRSERKTKKNK